MPIDKHAAQAKTRLTETHMVCRVLSGASTSSASRSFQAPPRAELRCRNVVRARRPSGQWRVRATGEEDDQQALVELLEAAMQQAQANEEADSKALTRAKLKEIDWLEFGQDPPGHRAGAPPPPPTRLAQPVAQPLLPYVAPASCFLAYPAPPLSLCLSAGFVAIIGRPNAGKSTLLNSLLGQALSIVTHKAQTTRHRVLGILSEPEYQAVFLDTPGIIQASARARRAGRQERRAGGLRACPGGGWGPSAGWTSGWLAGWSYVVAAGA